MEAELKVVIQMKGEQATVGVQAKGTDPVLEILQASSLEEALGQVQAVLVRAREKWAVSPKNPAYQGPPPPSAPARPAPVPAPQPQRRAETQQPRFF